MQVRGRSVDLGECRPELNHATNAGVVVGRRALTKGVFLDRRVFLSSYDPVRTASRARTWVNAVCSVCPPCGCTRVQFLRLTGLRVCVRERARPPSWPQTHRKKSPAAFIKRVHGCAGVVVRRRAMMSEVRVWSWCWRRPFACAPGSTWSTCSPRPTHTTMALGPRYVTRSCMRCCCFAMQIAAVWLLQCPINITTCGLCVS